MGTVGTHAINATLFKRLPYDPLRDFVPVSFAGYSPTFLVVPGNSPLKSVKDLAEQARKPGGLSFASAGNGTSGHLAGELLKARLGGQMLHVPYKGGAPAVQALLCSAVALLLDIGEVAAGPRYPAHTVVNQAVDAARHDRQTERQAPFINACLRRFLREREALLAGIEGDLVARWNHPLWWIQRLQKDHPEHWQAILTANNQPGPMALRVNRRRTDRASYQQALQAIGLASTPVGSDGLVLEAPQPVERLPGFAQGHCSVQDAAAQMAATLLLEGRNWSAADLVLDACAAPG
eukprot:gene26003-47185_t